MMSDAWSKEGGNTDGMAVDVVSGWKSVGVKKGWW
jgi:hypothetical protein